MILSNLVSNKKWINNLVGRWKGFASCSECGDSLYWKPYQSILYDDHSGMFPLCRECFNRLDTTAILRHCANLYMSWRLNQPDTWPPLPVFPHTRLEQEIKRLKS
jgi:hypothetical protein